MDITAWWGWLIVALVAVQVLAVAAGLTVALRALRKYFPLIKMARSMRR